MRQRGEGARERVFREEPQNLGPTTVTAAKLPSVLEPEAFGHTAQAER